MSHPITVTREHLDLSTLSSGTRAVLGAWGGGGIEGRERRGEREGEEGREGGGRRGGGGREYSLISLTEGKS